MSSGWGGGFGGSSFGSGGGFSGGGGYSGGGGLGELVMPLDARQKEAIEAAFGAAQRNTRAPIVCVLAGASADYQMAPLLWTGLLGLLTPWPLLMFTQLSAQRIFLAQILVCFAAWGLRC